MKSLTQWLQQFVQEVRTSSSGASVADAFDHSLAAAFVSVPPNLPAGASQPVTHGPLSGPALATPPRAGQTASVWPTPPRQTPAPSSPLWGTVTSPRNMGAEAAGSSSCPSERSPSSPLAALAASFGSPRTAKAASPPGTPSGDWPTTARPTPQAAAATAAPPAVSVASQDASTAAWPLEPPLDRAQPAPNLSAAAGSAVIPLAELLRDLVPVSASEARLEALWQQRSGSFGNEPAGWPAAAGSTTPGSSAPVSSSAVSSSAVDWNDLARRLADLEAGQAG